MTSSESMQTRVEKVFETIRPSIQQHEGDIEFVQFVDGILSVRFLGACIGCPISTFTLKLGIEEAIKAAIPEVIEVIAVE